MDNCLDCKFCHIDMVAKIIENLECRRYPPQLIEIDKWIFCHDCYIKDGKEIKTLFPILPNCGKSTLFWCGEFKKK